MNEVLGRDVGKVTLFLLESPTLADGPHVGDEVSPHFSATGKLLW